MRISYLTWKHCWGPWLNVRGEVQGQAERGGGWEDMIGDGIMLKVAVMAKNDVLGVQAGEMKSENHGISTLDSSGERDSESRTVGHGKDAVKHHLLKNEDILDVMEWKA